MARQTARNRGKDRRGAGGRKPPSSASVSSSTTKPKRARGRPARPKQATEAKRQAILKAALNVFAEHGFEAARLDDVAERAGVAKGTLYLYFPDKQAMLEAIVRQAAAPVIAGVAALPAFPNLTFAQKLERLFRLFRHEVLGSERKLIIRLLISEGPRFPALAAFYHREVLSRVLTALEGMAQEAEARGELASAEITRFPQLIMAPLLLSVVWDGMFQKLDPLDIEAMLETHARLLSGKQRSRPR